MSIRSCGTVISLRGAPLRAFLRAAEWTRSCTTGLGDRRARRDILRPSEAVLRDIDLCGGGTVRSHCDTLSGNKI